ncbi:hypothetical protein EBT31_12475 [bacterium]|nr:hypothetical protein [bacterium]
MLVPQIEGLREVVDEYHLWLNTTKTDDVDYIKGLESDFIKVKPLPDDVRVNGIFSIPVFYRYCTDPGTIYVRFDDDIILIDSLEAFKSFLDFRIDNPEYFLVMPNILNNACMTHIHQRLGNFKCSELVHYNVTDEVGWKNGSFAVCMHHEILNRLSDQKDLSVYRFNGKWILMYKEEFSINCISWFGRGFDGRVDAPEETFLTTKYTHIHNKLNCVYGGFCVVHYAFSPQRACVDSYDILSKYKLLCSTSFSSA